MGKRDTQATIKKRWLKWRGVGFTLRLRSETHPCAAV